MEANTMKKLLALLFLVSIPVLSEGPIYQHKEPEKQLEFQNIYKDIYTVKNGSILKSSSTIVYSDGPNFKISSSGEVTQPLQPSFLVSLTSQQNNVIGDSTVYTVPFDAEVFDQGADFGSNTFTAPITGRYFLQCAIDVEGINNTHEYMQIGIVTSNRTYRSTLTINEAKNTGQLMTMSVLADMDVNDTATVTVTLQSGDKVGDVYGAAVANQWTYFSGSLIN